MTSAHLRPCPACTRHVRVSEAGCPFCGERFDEAFHASPRPQPPAQPGVRLTRAALFALGTGAVAFAPACSPSTGAPHEADSGNSQGDDSSVVALYGAPFDGGSIGPLYGIAPYDAATADAGAGDAGTDAPVVQPAYGGPPRDAEPDQLTIIPAYGVPPH